MKTKQYILSACTLLLLALWIPVSLDKFWDLEGFHRTLLRQPFLAAWADVLYWLLPILELACALLLVGGAIVNPKTNQTIRFRTWGFALSSLLMLGFTLFILLGVLGWYDKRPCGCGSVISGLSWEQHLWFNLVFLLISVLGWWLSGDVRSGGGGHPGSPGQGSVHPSGPSTLDAGMKAKKTRSLHFVQPFRYARRFAVFPGRPVYYTRL
jgi:hypothetical protein